MRLLFNAALAFTAVTLFAAPGRLPGALSPGWQAVAADLASTHPQARLARQAFALFQSGTDRAR